MSKFQHWPASNILALYHLADVNDASGNSHTLTNNGTVAFGAGKFGNCALLGSANSSKYLHHGDGLGEDLSGGASISVWFMIQTAPGTDNAQNIVRWGSTTGTAREFYFAYIDVSGTKYLRFYQSGGTTDFTITLSTGVWYKVDIVLDSTCLVFLNGNQIISVARSSAITFTNSIILGNSTGGSDYMKGNIDEAVFFSAARTAAAIRRRYAFERGMLM